MEPERSDPVAVRAPTAAASAVPGGRPAAAATSPVRTSRRTLNRNPNQGGDEMFSPTSAAALALSSMFQLGGGAQPSNQGRPAPEELKGTRLFNGNAAPVDHAVGAEHNAAGQTGATRAPPEARHHFVNFNGGPYGHPGAPPRYPGWPQQTGGEATDSQPTPTGVVPGKSASSGSAASGTSASPWALSGYYQGNRPAVVGPSPHPHYPQQLVEGGYYHPVSQICAGLTNLFVVPPL